MSPTVEDEVRQALRAATDELAPSPQLLTLATAGGRRRVLRRRALVACATVGVVAVAGVAVMPKGESDFAPATNDTRDIAVRLLTRPTGGDLAGDDAFRRSAVTAWTTRPHKGQKATQLGEPRVVWAGATPPGRAAVVVQPATLLPDLPGSSPERGILTGVLEQDAAGVWSVYEGRYPGPLTIAFFTGPGGLDLVTPDTGRPLEYSIPPPNVGGQLLGGDPGNWKPMRLTAGAYRARVPVGTILGGVSIRPVGEHRSRESVVLAHNKVLIDDANSRPNRWGLSWDAVLPAGSTAGWSAPPPAGAGSPLREAIATKPGVTPDGKWSVYGTAPDGARFVIGEALHKDGPSQLYGVLLTAGGGSQLFHAGVVNGESALPVIATLPGNRGIVIAQHESRLRWRTGSGPWSAPAMSAALVPPGTTEVELLPSTGVPEILPLP